LGVFFKLAKDKEGDTGGIWKRGGKERGGAIDRGRERGREVEQWKDGAG